MANDRYKGEQSWGSVTFELRDFVPSVDETRDLLIKVIEQAIRDYIRLHDTKNYVEAEDLFTAEEFLFNDDYFIDFGDEELNCEQILAMLSIEIKWLRDKIRNAKRLKEIKLRNEQN